MKSITVTSGGIAFKIWILAMAVNTIGGSLLLAGFRLDIFLYAMVGGFFGLIFSFPVFLVIWKLLYHLFKKRYSSVEVFAALLVAAIVLAALAYGLFSLVFPMGRDGFLLLLLATVSGSGGVVLSYGNIKRYCDKRADAELEIEHIGKPENNYN